MGCGRNIFPTAADGGIGSPGAKRGFCIGPFNPLPNYWQKMGLPVFGRPQRGHPYGPDAQANGGHGMPSVREVLRPGGVEPEQVDGGVPEGEGQSRHIVGFRDGDL